MILSGRVRYDQSFSDPIRSTCVVMGTKEIDGLRDIMKPLSQGLVFKIATMIECTPSSGWWRGAAYFKAETDLQAWANGHETLNKRNRKLSRAQ